MEIKQVAIAYFSPTGTTKRTLRAVAGNFGCSSFPGNGLGRSQKPRPRPATQAGRAGDRRDAGLLRTHSVVVPHEGLPLRGEGTAVRAGRGVAATGITTMQFWNSKRSARRRGA